MCNNFEGNLALLRIIADRYEEELDNTYEDIL